VPPEFVPTSFTAAPVVNNNTMSSGYNNSNSNNCFKNQLSSLESSKLRVRAAGVDHGAGGANPAPATTTTG